MDKTIEQKYLFKVLPKIIAFRLFTLCLPLNSYAS